MRITETTVEPCLTNTLLMWIPLYFRHVHEAPSFEKPHDKAYQEKNILILPHIKHAGFLQTRRLVGMSKNVFNTVISSWRYVEAYTIRVV